MTVETEADDWLEASGSSGLDLLPMLISQSEEIGADADLAISDQMKLLVDAGPAHDSVAGVNQWRGQFDLLNNSQSDDNVLGGPQLASRYEAAMDNFPGELGGAIRTRILIDQSRGVPRLVMKSINAVLAEHEAKQMRAKLKAGGLVACLYPYIRMHL